MSKRTREQDRAYLKAYRAKKRAEAGHSTHASPPVLCPNCGQWQAASHIYQHEKQCFSESRNARRGRPWHEQEPS